jgi:hypothetical protein
VTGIGAELRNIACAAIALGGGSVSFLAKGYEDIGNVS